MRASRFFDSLRRRFTERSFARYFSQEIWQGNWRSAYSLDNIKEDGRYGTLASLMARYAAGAPILDVGCGDGLLEDRCRAAVGVRMVGIDYSSAAIERARARNIRGCEFVTADYREFQSDEKFSVIVLNESLYYVDDFPRIMRNFSRLLTPTGVFIVSMYDTRVTRRIWKVLERTHATLQGVVIGDESTGESWTIRVLRASAEPHAE